MTYIAVIECDSDQDLDRNKYYLLLTNDGYIAAFSSIDVGLNYFCREYERSDWRRLEPSLGAVVNWLFFRPSVVLVRGDREIRNWFPDPYRLHIETVAHTSGKFRGIEIPYEIGKSSWERGTRPALIKSATPKPEGPL